MQDLLKAFRQSLLYHNPLAADLDPKLQDSAQRLTNQAVSLLQSNQIQQAIAVIEEALEVDPACIEAIRLARLLERRIGSEYQMQREEAYLRRLEAILSDQSLSFTGAGGSYDRRHELRSLCLKISSFDSAPRLMRLMTEKIALEGRGSVNEKRTSPNSSDSSQSQVSIVIPVFNRESAVKKTFFSVLSQTYTNWEIVFVDDASTDNSLQVLHQLRERHADRKIRVEALPYNHGIGSVRNIGVSLTESDLIVLLDSDDTIAPRYLELTLAAMAEHPEAAWAVPLTVQHGTINRLFGFERLSIEGLLQRNLYNITNLMRKSVFVELGGLREEMKEGLEDWDFWIRAVLKGYRPVQLRTPLFFYNRHDHGVMGAVQELQDRWIRSKAQLIAGCAEVYQQPSEVGVALTGKNLSIQPELLNWEGIKAALIRPNPFAKVEKTGSQVMRNGARESVRKVLFICHDFPPHRVAGAQMYALMLAKQLKQRGVDVEVLHPTMRKEYPPDYQIREDEWEGVQVYKLAKEIRPEHEKLRIPQVEQVIRQFLSTHQYDLVHIHGLGQLSTAPIYAAKQAGLPVVMTLHDFWLLCDQWHMVDHTGSACSGPETPQKCAECYLSRIGIGQSEEQITEAIKYQSWRRRQFLGAFAELDLAMAPSRFFADRFAQYGMMGVNYHPLGFEAVRTHEKPVRETPVFGYFGQIIYRKGLDLLPEVFSDPRLSQAKLLVYGKANERAYGERVLEALGKLPNVTYKGVYRPEELPDIYAEIDVSILPTRMDNYPLTVLEAFQQNTPVIASRVGGIPELIEHGVNGMLFEPGSVEDLKQAVLSFVENPNLARSMGANIRPVTAVAHDVDATLETYIEVLNAKRI